MFSRQFRALCRTALLWAVPWAAVGVGVALWNWTKYNVGLPPSQHFPLGAWLLMEASRTAAIGAMSAFSAALLVGRAEQGHVVEQIPTWRAMAWGGLGGMVPLTLFALFAAPLGLPVENFPLMLSLGVGAALTTGALVGASVAAAKRRGELGRPERKHLPAI